MIKPDNEKSGLKIYLRNGCSDIIENLMHPSMREHFDLAVWSSQSKEHTELMSKLIFGHHYRVSLSRNLNL